MKSYLLSRYMIGLLIFTVGSQVLGTFFVLSVPVTSREFLLFLLLGLTFLFFMRVIDDYNDRDHDALFYRERSIQQGEIDLHTLMGVAGLLMMIIGSIFFYFYGILPVLLILLAVGNTALSTIGFGLGKNLRFTNIIAYHLLNSLGLGIIQASLYVILWNPSFSWGVIMLHFLMMFLNNFLIEVIRKIKHQGEISHNDDYISLLGKTWNYILINILFLKLIAGTSIIFFLYGNIGSIGLLSYILSGIFLVFLSFLYYKKNTKSRKKILILATLLFYLFSNCVYYFL